MNYLPGTASLIEEIDSNFYLCVLIVSGVAERYYAHTGLGL